jgi:arylsulfatase A-like enzyme
MRTATLTLLTVTLLLCTVHAAERPHVILIMVDDMGFSDLGYHGGEIDTPNLDALAHGGVRFSQFYNSGRCCPTRATLMTGLHPHQAGVGHMTQPPGSDRGKNRPPAYQGYLNRNCVTIAEVLKQHGYATLMAGKWHLGYNDQSRWPLQRGFERYFGCLSGATRFFHPEHPRGMTFGNESIENPESTTDRPFYTTDAFTDYAIRFLKEEQAGKQRPMFLYLAYTAPHWPLQAHEEDIAKYRGKYKIGWDKLRERRFQRQLELGLIDSNCILSPRAPNIPAWDSLDEEKRDEMDLKMAVYAAMVDRVDQNIGRLIAHLKEAGVYDDAMILFLSDNGGCQEGGMLGRGKFHDVEKRNLQSANSYGEAWANASNTPFRLYKHFAHEGGAATPFFIHWPAKISPRNEWFSDPAQLIDVMPTILDVAGASYPSEFHGNTIPALDGVSLRPAFDGESLGRANPIFIEHENNAFARSGDWKLVGRGVSPAGGVDPSKWELYDMSKDRTETNNLAPTMSAKTRELAALWNVWAKRAQVYPKNRPGASEAEPVAEPNPPDVAGHAFSVTATIDAKHARGVVVSHGGLRFGYALHFRDGRPAFSIRNEGKLTELFAEQPIEGKVTVSATLDAERMSISVDGEVVASRKSPGLLAEQPAIGLYIGQDGKDPVGKYEMPGTFRGKILGHKIDVVIPKVTMRTPWGEQVTAENVWREYPRPTLRRDDWTNLNGHWDYAVTSLDTEAAPQKWTGKILVPFAIEAPLSGVEHRFSPHEALWYRRAIDVDKRNDRRYRLNFEAVDYRCTLRVNGKEVGSHTGGNLPFSFDVTPALIDGENTIVLRVTDATDKRGAYQLHGKQRLNPRGIWYTSVSGIWQTVWLEEVPQLCVTGLKITPHIDGKVDIQVTTDGPIAGELIAKATASLDGTQVAQATGSPDTLELTIPNPKLWSPDSPTLYDLTIKVGDDVVRSYVGLREVGRERDDNGHWRFTLNGKPIFHWGTLDQGWWPDGLLTPPSDAALKSDIVFLKAAGFNTIRKHIKVEPRRFYYHCDQIGMLVWQDQVSHREPVEDPEWTRLHPNPQTATWPAADHLQFMSELQTMIDTLYSHPCIVQWVLFNERWGQHQTMEVGKWTVAYDPTRAVNIASGGNFLPVGHIVDHHQYPHPAFPFELGAGGRFDDYVKIVGEFGGHGFPVEGRLWATKSRNWGYGGLPKDKEEWLERYRESTRLLAELKKQGVAAGIYTQTTDVEREINGLLTYDRRVQKLPPEKLAEIHREAGIVD